MFKKTVAYKRRNEIGFYLISFDIIDSKNKTGFYSKVYKLLQEAVEEDNYYQTLRQYCVVRTNIMENSLIEIVRSVCGEECNVFVSKLTSVPAFSFYNNVDENDAERLKKDMHEDFGI